jgi:hypothetical protein
MSTNLDKQHLKDANVYIKGPTGFIALGQAKACILTLKDGRSYSFGKVEDVFDLEITPEDKKLMKEMRIGR